MCIAKLCGENIKKVIGLEVEWFQQCSVCGGQGLQRMLDSEVDVTDSMDRYALASRKDIKVGFDAESM